MNTTQKFIVIVEDKKSKEQNVSNFKAPSISALFSHLSNLTRDPGPKGIHNVGRIIIIPQD